MKLMLIPVHASIKHVIIMCIMTCNYYAKHVIWYFQIVLVTVIVLINLLIISGTNNTEAVQLKIKELLLSWRNILISY